MTDIVERMRKQCTCEQCAWEVDEVLKEAADEIEKLRDALQEIANIKISPEDGVNKYIMFKARTIARIAIGVTDYE